jgi:nuclear pore complex protein Nup54
VPVLAIGFEDVWKRMELQSNLVDRHQNKLQESDDRLKQVQRKNTLDTSVKLEEYKRRHIDLSKRLLRVQFDKS